MPCVLLVSRVYSAAIGLQLHIWVFAVVIVENFSRQAFSVEVPLDTCLPGDGPPQWEGQQVSGRPSRNCDSVQVDVAVQISPVPWRAIMIRPGPSAAAGDDPPGLWIQGSVEAHSTDTVTSARAACLGVLIAI